MTKQASQKHEYLHDKCYARSLGGCSTKITKEHFISKSLLEEMGGRFSVSGLSWLPKGDTRILSKESLQANILCKTHNEALTVLDETGAKFYRMLRAAHNNLVGESIDDSLSVDEGFDIDGELFERWIFKVLCGTLASGNVTKDGQRFRWEPDDFWVRLLFGLERWPERAGLYMGIGRDGFSPASDQTISMSVMHGSNFERPVIGCKFKLIGLTFLLMVVSGDYNILDDEVSGITYRPGDICFRRHNNMKRIKLRWGAEWKGDPVLIDVHSIA